MFMSLVIARKFQDNEISIIKGILQFKYLLLIVFLFENTEHEIPFSWHFYPQA